jgi:hypothetical protein
MGKVEEYSPAYGLTFQVGEADYPDEIAEALVATGRFKAALPPRPPKGESTEKE